MAVNFSKEMELENLMTEISYLTKESKEVYKIFLKTKHEMEKTKDGLDKYYHAKANCSSAELGVVYSLWAIIFSLGKEIKDYYYKVYKLHMDYKKVAIDCWQDLKADWYGIQKAK